MIAENPRAELVAVADPNASRRAAAAELAPRAALIPSLDALHHRVDAVLIAAPPELHADLVMRALAAGADVFVEKPLATRVVDAERCVARAKVLGRVAMVGHLLRYHPTLERLIELTRAGELGRLVRFEAVRRSPSGDRSLAALWALGPHDLSVLEAIAQGPRVGLRGSVSADGFEIHVELASGATGSIALSRAAASKERRLRVVGETGSATFDEIVAPDRLLVNGREITVPWEEPLAREIDHFFACVEARTGPRTPFDDGLAVVRALAEAEAQIEASMAVRALAADG